MTDLRLTDAERTWVLSEYLREALCRIAVTAGVPVATDDGRPKPNGVLLEDIVQLLSDRANKTQEPTS